MDNFSFSAVGEGLVKPINHHSQLKGHNSSQRELTTINFKQHLNSIGILNMQTRTSLHSSLTSDLEQAFDK